MNKLLLLAIFLATLTCNTFATNFHIIQLWVDNENFPHTISYDYKITDTTNPKKELKALYEKAKKHDPNKKLDAMEVSIDFNYLFLAYDEGKKKSYQSPLYNAIIKLNPDSTYPQMFYLSLAKGEDLEKWLKHSFSRVAQESF